MPITLRSRVLAIVVCVVVLATLGRVAHAQPWLGAPRSHLDERDSDGSDLAGLAGARLGRGQVGATDVRSQSWITLKGFYGGRSDGTHDVGGMVVVGIAFDKIAAGPVHRVRDALHNFADSSAPKIAPAPAPPPPPTSSAPRLVLTPVLARSCVAAAWRASGLGVDDARIDAIVARARLSAALPETRLRVMRLVNDSTHTDTSSPTYYDYSGANLWLEARFTWRLDRLLYADDEPTLERVRLERHDARARISTRVLEALFAWQRAWLDRAGSAEGSREQLEAHVRMAEAETALDVLTAGWFAAWRATQTTLGLP